MKRIGILALLFALTALADEKVDLSHHQIDLPPRPPARVQWHFGFVEFRALGMDWRVLYLPIAVPLAGTHLNEAGKLPDPFALTNTAVAGARPFIIEPTAEVRREVRRVRRRTGL